MRLFAAIALPSRVRASVTAQATVLKRHATLTATWVDPRTLHLTVAFFGEVGDEARARLTQSLARAARRLNPTTITMDQPQLVPRGRPRVLALGVTADRAFGALQRAAVAAARAAGSSASTKPPHLTLARLKVPPRDPLPPGRAPRQTFVAHELELVRSTLTPQGPRYHVLERFPLSPVNQAQPSFRPNVAICVVNPRGEVLLVWHREHIRHYWQFLQGGLAPGESTAQAVRRELREELGLNQFRILSIREHVYRYRWPLRIIEQGTDPDKVGYVGQEQSLAIIRVPEVRPPLRPDAREAAATRWFSPTRWFQALNPVRRRLGKLAMVELQKLGYTANQP